MRISFFCFLIICSSFSFAQLPQGFQSSEASDMISLCNSYTFLHLFESDDQVIPNGYEKLYTSRVMGMDNKFQIYQKGDIGVINYRGSTDNTISWVENMYSAMIPATGMVKIQEDDFPYSFAQDSTAAVHAGYALAILFLSDQLLAQVNALNHNGIHDILITGHSQGGALSVMTQAYLENLPEGSIAPENNFKVYAFGNPMCGNKQFAEEYNTRFSDNKTSYAIINADDPIPYMPFGYGDEPIITTEKIFSWITGEEEFSYRQVAQKLIMRTFDGTITSYIQKSNALINRLISLKFGKIQMPEYVADINYFPTGSRQDLTSFDYPLIRLDSSKITKENEGDFKLAEDGYYYKKQPSFYQHNPYNYYVGVLKKYDSRQYNNLSPKYLNENL